MQRVSHRFMRPVLPSGWWQDEYAGSHKTAKTLFGRGILSCFTVSRDNASKRDRLVY
ncbi:hypothetical protein [Caenispirillum salinarum]|uniref:hypothetical protein n=1 Tax=Caenispirillum salinarum TaxID=859058 RepID=UPI00384CFCB0